MELKWTFLTHRFNVPLLCVYVSELKISWRGWTWHSISEAAHFTSLPWCYCSLDFTLYFPGQTHWRFKDYLKPCRYHANFGQISLTDDVRKNRTQIPYHLFIVISQDFQTHIFHIHTKAIVSTPSVFPIINSIFYDSVIINASFLEE